ncbi:MULTISPECIES: histone-like nucleoid-structuring protein Lsr2 [Auritidibacter]|uniref:Lsr2 family protein n=1 Tax=Auritidibacter ignavus TaxID=678932 RepID=A0AAJ6ALN4_9MICC|nr:MULTISPECIES: Lsr2 family protein [Auritidibacter]PXA81728.1 hypothetical protein DCC26_02065 [Auritidibacter sp. NML120779]NIH72605.1 hypothetical protein [Auritidibacter ignavus]PXA75441.1 hypothetical protein DCC24_11005 [Auritidibacter sp. NML100628]PXA79153.1 hypothetical protein DCC25_10060 [Auritidibacter sp. NML120636]RMX21484.1 Lsr2 family protein [Auritidibacter ignavus]
MARKTEVVLIDDLDGSPADETLIFGFDGRHYQIDLSKENADAFRKLLKPYIRKAESIAPPAPGNEAAKIREWARKNGYNVSRRGRLHRDIEEAYRNAHKR